jgi:hypothetical protein
MDELERFIIAAKAACYVGDGAAATASRLGSHDLVFERGDWSYRDSYFGGTEFIGQEVVWWRDEAVWAMNYCGRVLRDDLIDGSRAGNVIKQALSGMYAEGRFLGGWTFVYGDYLYTDENEGDVSAFHGQEVIKHDDVVCYELRYHGGRIKS